MGANKTHTLTIRRDFAARHDLTGRDRGTGDPAACPGNDRRGANLSDRLVSAGILSIILSKLNLF
jgi:hypothetical protein